MKVIKSHNNLPLFDQFFDGFFRDEPLHWMNKTTGHSRADLVNISESDEGFEIELMAPGYRKEDLHIEVDGDLLHLKAEREESTENEKRNYLRREFSIQKLERQFRLPEDKIDIDKIEARFEDGVLFVQLPKKAEVKKASRLIEVH
jgi:HSP20 family protein